MYERGSGRGGEGQGLAGCVRNTRQRDGGEGSSPSPALEVMEPSVRLLRDTSQTTSVANRRPVSYGKR